MCSDRIPSTVILVQRLYYLLESLRIIHSQIGEDLAVEAYIVLGKLADELGVIQTVSSYGCIDSLDPEYPVVSLLVLAVVVGVCPTFLKGVLCYGVDVSPCVEIAFGLL